MSNYTLPRENTRAHWALYALSAYEERSDDDEPVTTRRLYELVGGDDSAVFTHPIDLSAVLSDLSNRGFIERRTHRMTEFDDVDVEYEVRLNDTGREAIWRLGTPSLLPNRRREGYDRSLPKELSFTPPRPPFLEPELDDVVLPAGRAKREGETVRSGHADEGEVTYTGIEEAISPDDSGDDADEREVIGTVDLSPEWDWLGAQLYKLGFPAWAERAFKAQLSPAEVYGPVLELLYHHRHDPDANLDFGAPFDGALSTVEKPVDPNELSIIKGRLGVAEYEDGEKIEA